MRVLITLLIASILGIVLFAKCLEAKILSKCEIVKEIKKYAPNSPSFSNSLLSNWICLIDQESGRNTTKVSPIIPPPNEAYGLFQINSKQWCRQTFIGGDCKMMCKDLLSDNIKKAVQCADLIYHKEGFKAWKGWLNKCKGRPLPNINDCKIYFDGKKSDQDDLQPALLNPYRRVAEHRVLSGYDFRLV